MPISLREFSQTPEPPPAAAAPARWPIVFFWPAGARIATPTTWQRLEDGRIKATYADITELRLCIELTQMIRETEAPKVQGELIPQPVRYE